MLLLCHIKEHILTLMDEDCTILRYTYGERSLLRFIFGSWCCWIFSSFAYFLAWGDAAIDDPSHAAVAAPSPQPRGVEVQMLQPGAYHHVNDPGYAHIPQVQMPIH